MTDALTRPIEGREYAVRQGGEWHIATWDSTAFEVTSDHQSGDRWTLDMVEQHVLLPVS